MNMIQITVGEYEALLKCSAECNQFKRWHREEQNEVLDLRDKLNHAQMLVIDYHRRLEDAQIRLTAEQARYNHILPNCVPDAELAALRKDAERLDKLQGALSAGPEWQFISIDENGVHSAHNLSGPNHYTSIREAIDAWTPPASPSEGQDVDGAEVRVEAARNGR